MVIVLNPSLARNYELGSERLAGLAVVLLLHGVLIYALLAWIDRAAIQAPPPATTLAPVATIEHPQPPLVHPQVVLLSPPPSSTMHLAEMPRIDVILDNPVLPGLPAQTMPSSLPGIEPASIPVIVRPGFDPSHPIERPDYPASAARRGEAGVTLLDCLIGPDGRVVEARIKRSSGFDDLDRAALNGALARFRFRPGSEDGKPAAMHLDVPVRWELVE